jgi:hypothetical protein
MDYVKRFFTSDNMVISFVGDLSKGKLEKMMDRQIVGNSFYRDKVKYDISFGMDFNLGKTSIKLVGNIQIVFDTAYFVHLNRYRQLNLPEAGRNFMLTLLVPFKSSKTVS